MFMVCLMRNGRKSIENNNGLTMKKFKDVIFLSYEQSMNKDIAKKLSIDFWTTIVIYKGKNKVARFNRSN